MFLCPRWPEPVSLLPCRPQVDKRLAPNNLALTTLLSNLSMCLHHTDAILQLRALLHAKATGAAPPAVDVQVLARPHTFRTAPVTTATTTTAITTTATATAITTATTTAVTSTVTIVAITITVTAPILLSRI